MIAYRVRPAGTMITMLECVRRYQMGAVTIIEIISRAENNVKPTAAETVSR